MTRFMLPRECGSLHGCHSDSKTAAYKEESAVKKKEK